MAAYDAATETDLQAMDRSRRGGMHCRMHHGMASITSNAAQDKLR